MSNDLNIAALIPAYNVEPYIGILIDRLKNYLPPENILIVNDGSTDRTGEIARLCDVTVIENETNCGKGFALRKGFDYLINKNADWIITLDGDRQHDPDMVPDFIQTAQASNADLIIGVRKRSGNMPWDRRFSNWSTSLLLSIVAGRKILDAQSGYRMIRGSALRGMEFETGRYDFETEYLLKSIKKGAKLGWVDIPTIYSGSPSSMHRVKDTIRFLRVVFRSVFKSS